MIARIEVFVLAPLSWLAARGGDAPVKAGRAPYRVELVNPSGDHWTLALRETEQEAIASRGVFLARIEQLGFDVWSESAPVRPSFFDREGRS